MFFFLGFRRRTGIMDENQYIDKTLGTIFLDGGDLMGIYAV